MNSETKLIDRALFAVGVVILICIVIEFVR